MADLESLYRDIILDHYRSPRHRGELESPPALRSEGFNPLCGDEVLLTFLVEDGVVTDLAVSGQGCSISQASASMMSQAVIGKPIEDIRQLAARFKAMMGIDAAGDAANGADSDSTSKSLGDLEAMRGVIKFPVRIKCATLAWNALLTGLDEAASA